MSKALPKVPGYTTVDVVAFVQMKLSQDPIWAARSCVAIYEQQTQEEKKSRQSVSGRNNRGFDRFDAPRLTSLALRARSNRLTEQDKILLCTFMKKYARQLIQLAWEKDQFTSLKFHLDKYFHNQQSVPF